MAVLVRGRPRERFLAALLLALAAAAGTALAFGARAAANAQRPILVPTSPPATTAATTTGLTTTATVSTNTVPETTSAATVTTPPPPPPPGTAGWPGGTGWTVILASIPVSAGRGDALAEARRAASSGLGRVGVLLSSDYRSLHAGYWVVFAGVYPTSAAAQAALRAAHAHGYAGAYPALVEV